MNTSALHMIGAVSAQPIGLDVIDTLLSLPKIDLEYGNQFTGKPTTILHVDEHFVLKGEQARGFASLEIASAWATHRLKKEKVSQLYHPDKTWVVQKDHVSYRVYNVAPRLSPLHVVMEDTSVLASEKVGYLLRLTGLYLGYVKNHEERLDEGLSNFGIDQNHQLYYMDDDFYQWDQLLSFTNMVAHWLRKFSRSWLNEPEVTTLALGIRQHIEAYLAQQRGVDYVGVLSEHLSCQYFKGKAEERCNTICKLLRQEEEKKGCDARSKLTLIKATSQKNVQQWFKEDQPIAILADVHANLPALEAVLADLAEQNIQRILCLGDVVGYGPHPSECIQRLQALPQMYAIRGNHDHMIGANKVLKVMSKSGLEVAKWTLQRVAVAERHWLATLPLRCMADDWLLVHGAPRDTTFFNAYVYERTADLNLQWMQENQVKLCFHGHSHLQGMYQMKHDTSEHSNQLGTYPLIKSGVNLICAGAVGQPRSGNVGAEYAVFQPKEWEITFKRLAYDVESVVRDMEKYQFPAQLMTRLQQGY